MCINKHKKTCQFPKQSFSFRQTLEWFWAHSSLNISVLYVFAVIQLLWLVWGRSRDLYNTQLNHSRDLKSLPWVMSRHNTDFPNPPLSWLAVGTWCWWCWVTARMGDAEADNTAVSTICSWSAQEAEGSVPHMPSEAYQNEKPLRYEDIQLLLHRLPLFSSRTNILHKLHSNLGGTLQKKKKRSYRFNDDLYLNVFSHGEILLPAINFIPF